MKVLCKIINSSERSWRELFNDASAYATQIGRENLISISHSADNDDGVIAIWYWADDWAKVDEDEG